MMMMMILMVCALAAVTTTTTTAFRASQPRPRIPRQPTVRSLSSLSLLPGFVPDDQWGLYGVITTTAACALRLERTTALGKSLSGPVTAMLITALLTNIGILPAAGSVHLTNLQGFVLRVATPLLLLGADLRKIFRETGVMLQAFLLGTVGTLLGSFVAMIVLAGPLSTVGLPGDGWKVAAALTAKNIGGGLNFFAVTNALSLSPATLGAGLAVDNLLGLLYFPFISWLGTPYDESDASKESVGGVEDTEKTNSSVTADVADGRDEVEKMMAALAVGTATAAAAEAVSKACGVPALSVPISTIFAVVLATAFPQQLGGIIPQGELLGKLLLLLFFASVGNASGTIASTFAATGAVYLLAFGLVLYAVHLTVILGLGKLWRIPLPDLLIASNANIGNAATASSLATSKGWKSRLLPGILVGTLGNSIGTFAGLWLGTHVFRPLSGF